jgi:uncharacterized protein (DUF1501 family)
MGAQAGRARCGEERLVNRRRALQLLAASPLAVRLPAHAALPRPRLLVMVFLYGGNDGFNTWVPYTDRLYYRLRPTLALPRDSVIRFTDHHGWHPEMRPLVPAWQAGEVAIVQGVGYAECTQQHYRDEEIAFTAVDQEVAADEGWVARALSRAAWKPQGLAGVGFDVLDIRGLDPMGPFRGEHVAAVQVHNAAELLARRRIADCDIVANARAQPLLAERAALPARSFQTAFPDDPFGVAMRAAVELAAADPLLPVVHVALNGLDGDKHHAFDTHWKQLQYHGAALRRLAEGLAALRSGLRAIGRWDDTLVATYDEFGRSPVENDNGGTHHGLATTHLVMGGRVKGGLYGEAPPVQDLHPIGGPAPTVDTRQLWSAVVRDWWGLDATAVFGRRYPRLDLLRA